MDSRNNETIKNLIGRTVEEFGKLDILINNAGTILVKPFLETTMEDWDFMVETDGRSYVYSMQQAIPHMIKNGGGSVLNIASLAALKPNVDYSIYCFVKAGINMLSRVVAKEVAKYNVRVNVLCPGSTMTPMIEGSPLNEERLERIPLGRLGTPEDVAFAALYFCSDEAGFLNGSCLVIDGGSM
jgi:NAD(P)-dependent dehydrogenase (short-subunit alcohol dehydrogenase family)